MKMVDADETWAVVVGIDEYQHVEHLKGAARDAVASVTWLRALGVPDGQIRLHAAPSPEARAEVKALGLDVFGCTHSDLEQAFLWLLDKRGAKLFVMLSGHGLFEPGGERVFLTSDATPEVARNIGIDWHLWYFSTLNFPQQVVVMDGCLNVPYNPNARAKFHGEKMEVVGDRSVRADVRQHVCFGARIGQRAAEGQGRGLFSKALLDALDPASPNPHCVVVDDETGALAYDLVAAVDDVARPIVVRQAAAEHQLQQEPQVRTDASRPVRVASFPPDEVVRVAVTLTPEDALTDVSKVTIWSDDIDWHRVVPTPPDAVPAQFRSLLPAGMRWKIGCSVASGSEWLQPPDERFQSDADRDVSFSFVRSSTDAGAVGAPADRMAGLPRVEINTIRTDTGATHYNLADYSAIETLLHANGPGVALETHESGPVLYALDGEWSTLQSVVLDVASSMERSMPDGFTVRVHGLAAMQPQSTSISVPLTDQHAHGLVGFGIHDANIEIDDVARSASELAAGDRIALDPGPHTIRVAVPWGLWTDRIVVEPGEHATLTLPPHVGLPPLRVMLLRDHLPYGGDQAHTVVTVGTRARPRLWEDGVAFTRGESADWSGAYWLPPILDAWAPLATLRRRGARLVFPLSRSGAVAVDAGDQPRAEPLSGTTSAQWDRLVAAGRLDELSEDEATELTQQKWVDPLLGVAGAYACYVQGRSDYLREVLGNLRELASDLPDTWILTAAWSGMTNDHDGELEKAARAQLARLGEEGLVPVFRWGLAIGADEAERDGLTKLAARYRAISERLMPGSIWTLWEED